MTEQELKHAVQQSIDHRLSALQGNPFLAQRIIAAEKGDPPVVKKKISVSLIVVLVLMMLTLSIGCALVSSRIANEMYGQEPAPQEVTDQIQLIHQNAESALGSLALDELLYDGSALHTSFTISNPSNEPLLYTVDGIWLNDAPLTRSTLITEGAGTAGLLLGGALDGTAMPASLSVYNRGDALYGFDPSGKYLGLSALPEGEASLRISIAVWRPLHPPRLVDYAEYEGADVTETLKCLATDRTGYVQLDLFRPEAYTLHHNASQLSSDVYAQAYKELGWAEFLDRIELKADVTLDKNQLSRVQPTQSEYMLDDLTLTVDRFELTHAGGSMEGWVYGEADAVKAFLGEGVYLADPEGNRVLNYGCWYDWSDETQAAHFRLEFDPVADPLPQNVSLAPFVAHDPRWDERSVSYNPAIAEPENVVGAYQLDLSRAICIELESSFSYRPVPHGAG